MKFLLASTVLLGTWQHISAQTFAGYAGNCVNVGYDAAAIVVVALNCGPKNASLPPVESRLSLDNCLAFVDGNLVGGQGGGYISKSNCSNCVGNTAYSYSCTCQGVKTPNLRLNDVIGVNSTDGNICCNAGSVENPAVRCGAS